MKNNYPEEIERLAIEAARLKHFIETARASIQVIEADLQLEIIAARDVEGKPVFGNERAREAAFVKACNDSEELQTLIAERRTHDFSLAETLAKYDRARSEFNLYLLEREEKSNQDILLALPFVGKVV